MVRIGFFVHVLQSIARVSSRPTGGASCVLGNGNKQHSVSLGYSSFYNLRQNGSSAKARIKLPVAAKIKAHKLGSAFLQQK